MTNRTDVRDFAQKKSYSVSAGVLEAGDFDGTNTLEVFNLPEKALVTNTYVVADEAGNSGLTLKVKVGSTTTIAAADVDTLGDISDADTKVATGTGSLVTVKPSAAVTEGKFAVIIEYVEYTLGTGHLTNYS